MYADNTFWKSKKVLVTGAGGFIASHLAEKLVHYGADVRAFVHYNATGNRGWLEESPLGREMDFFLGDICDRDSVASACKGREVVFHLAALIAIPYSYQAPESYVRTNIGGTLNVLQAGIQAGASRIVHTSTSEVYGTARQIPIAEDHPLQGQSPYSATKIGADKIVESFHLSFHAPVATVRPFNTFGPRQSARAVIPTIITQFLAGKPAKLGSVSPTRDLNFVYDTVDGFLAAGQSESAIGRTINLGSGREISIGDLALLIGNLMGVEAAIELDENRVRPENSEVQRLLASNELAKILLGWEPKTTLEDGLLTTIEWIKEHRHLYRPELFAV